MATLRGRIFGCVTALAAATLASSAWAGGITLIDVVNSNGYQFTNFDGPTPNAAGTTINGISNTGTVVGFTTPDNVNFNNFTANPLVSINANALNIDGSTTAMANGINSAGTVVGSDGNGNAFFQSGNSTVKFIPNGATLATAFGINDHGSIVGQYAVGETTPGFALNGQTVTTINAPSGPNVVNAQGINNNGLIVGYYVGTDNQDHGFTSKLGSAVNNVLTGTKVTDPTIPSVSG